MPVDADGGSSSLANLGFDLVGSKVGFRGNDLLSARQNDQRARNLVDAQKTNLWTVPQRRGIVAFKLGRARAELALRTRAEMAENNMAKTVENELDELTGLRLQQVAFVPI